MPPAAQPDPAPADAPAEALPDTTSAPASPLALVRDSTKLVSIRILPKGDGLVAKGGDGIAEFYARGDIVENVPLNVAQAQEDNGYAEIQAPAA